ncbi:MAG: antibiotic biosynthesis monooxygenase [Chloroflexi bacterium]|nr:antibiotic biosynthesis monooxygenase [Chloroflexota bacterium]
MIAVVAKIKAKKGEEKKVEKALRDVIPKVREEEGTVAYTLNRAQNDKTLFMVYEKYTDMDAFMHHSSTPYLAAMFTEIVPLLDGALQVEMYDEIM